MKSMALLCLASLAWPIQGKADLTLVQKVEGGNAPAGEVTIRIKGEKARIDVPPRMSTIIDGKTGDVVTLMNEEKKIVRISADKMKAAAEMINKFSDNKESPNESKPKPTGRKETIGGYEAEEYMVETPRFSAAYWVAPQFPDGVAILKQLQAVKSGIWNSARTNVPDYREFTALPIKCVFNMDHAKVTTTLISAKQGPLSDSDFTAPPGFREAGGLDRQHPPEIPKSSGEESPHS